MPAPRKPARRKPRVNPSKYRVNDEIFGKAMSAAQRERMAKAGKEITSATSRRRTTANTQPPGYEPKSANRPNVPSPRGDSRPKRSIPYPAVGSTVRRPEGIPYATQRSSSMANKAMNSMFNNAPKMPSSRKLVPSAPKKAGPGSATGTRK